MSNPQGIRAGQAYVELTADSRGLDRALAQAQARVRQYADQVAQLDKRIKAAGDGPAAGNLHRVRSGLAERQATAQQEAEGRRALQDRLALYKAEQAAKKAAITQDVADRIGLERALFEATRSARDIELRDCDEYFAKLRAKWAGNQELITQIEAAHARKRKQILEQSAGGIAAKGNSRLAGGLKVILGEGAEKVSQLAGGLGKVAAAVAAFKTALIATQAVQDRMLYSLHQSAGRLDECARISQTWVDNLSNLPIIGQYFGLLLQNVAAKNKEILADFAQMRQLGEKLWQSRQQDRFEVQTAGLTDSQRRQAEIDRDYHQRLQEAAQLSRTAGKYAADSPEATQYQQQAEEYRRIAEQVKKVQQDKLAGEQAAQRAQQQADLQRARIEAELDGAAQKRAALELQQAEELRQARITGEIDVDALRQKHAYERLVLEKDITREAREQAEAEAEKARQQAERLAQQHKDKAEVTEELQARLRAAETGEDAEKNWRPIAKRLEGLNAAPTELDRYKALWQQVEAAEKQRAKLDELKSWADQEVEAIRTPEQKLDEYLAKLDEAAGKGLLSADQRTALEAEARSKFQVDSAATAVSVSGTFNAAALRGLEAGDASSRIVKATEETARQTKLLVDTVRRSEGLTFTS